MQREQEFRYIARTGSPQEFTVYDGFIRSANPESALGELVRSFSNPSSVFAAKIMADTSESPVLARYLRKEQT